MIMNATRGPTRRGEHGPCAACGGRFKTIRDTYEVYLQCMGCSRSPEMARTVALARRAEAEAEAEATAAARPDKNEDAQTPRPAEACAPLSNEQARLEFAELRWPDGVACPDCSSREVVARERSGGWACTQCGRFFTPTTQSPAECIGRPSREWLIAAKEAARKGNTLSQADLCNSALARSRAGQAMVETLLAAMRTAGCDHAGPLSTDETAHMLNARTREEQRADRIAIEARQAKRAELKRAQELEKAQERAAAAERRTEEEQMNDLNGSAAEAAHITDQTADDQPPVDTPHTAAVIAAEEEIGGVRTSDQIWPPQVGTDPTAVEHTPGQAEEPFFDQMTTDNGEAEELERPIQPEEAEQPERATEPEEPEDPERVANEQLEAWRWPDGVWCAKCGGEDIAEGPPSTGMPYRCRGCNTSFNVRAGSLLSKTRTSSEAWEKALTIVVIQNERCTDSQLASRCGLNITEARNVSKRIQAARRMAERTPQTARTATITLVLNAGDPRTDKPTAKRRKRAGTAGQIETPASGNPPADNKPPTPEPEEVVRAAEPQPTVEEQSPAEAVVAAAPMATAPIEERMTLVEIAVAKLCEQAEGQPERLGRIEACLTEIRDGMNGRSGHASNPGASPCPHCGARTSESAGQESRCRNCGTAYRSGPAL